MTSVWQNRKGSTTIFCPTGAVHAVGDYLLIDQQSDGAFVTTEGVEGSCSWCSRESGTRALGHVIKIVGISDRHLPNSLYRASKPAYFGDVAWPPDRTGSNAHDRRIAV